MPGDVTVRGLRKTLSQKNCLTENSGFCVLKRSGSTLAKRLRISDVSSRVMPQKLKRMRSQPVVKMRRKKSAAEDVPVFNKFFSSSFSSTTVSSRYAKARHKKKKLLKFHAIYGAASRRTTENSGAPNEDVLRSEEVQLEQVKSRVVRQEVEDESAVSLPEPKVMPSITLLGSISSVVSGLLKFAVVMLTPRKRLIACMNQEEVAHYTKKTIHQPTLRKIEHAKRLDEEEEEEEEEKQREAAQERVKKYNQQKVTLRQKTQVLNKELAEQAKQVPKTAAVVLPKPPEPVVQVQPTAEVQPAVHFEPVAETASSTIDSMHSILDEFNRELERIRSISSSFSTAHHEVIHPEPVFYEPAAQTSPKTVSVHSPAPFAPRKYKFLQSESNEEFGITTTSGSPRARSSSLLIETFDDLIMQLEVDDHARNAALDINDKFKNSSNVKEFPKY